MIIIIIEILPKLEESPNRKSQNWKLTVSSNIWGKKKNMLQSLQNLVMPEVSMNFMCLGCETGSAADI